MGRPGGRVMHRIHLRGFWDCAVPEPGRVQFSRRFGRPTSRLEQKLFLVINAPQPVLQVTINGEPLTMVSSTSRIPISNLLPRNVLAIELTGDERTIPPDVTIEIED